MTLERLTHDSSEEEVFVFPASFAQQRLWFFDQLVPGTCLYNVPTVLRLTGTLNLAALESSVSEIVRRHEALRTTFGMVEGQPVQLIAPHLKVSLPVIDLQRLPSAQRKAEAQRLIAQEIQQPFNLSQGPLLRAMLLQLNAAEYVLILNLHHIVFDEWSIALLIRELGLLYPALMEGKPSPLPELPIQYADFAQWQREWLQGEVLSTQLAYWQQQLKDLLVLDLPERSPRPPRQSYRGATQLLELPLDLTEALNALSQQEGVTLFMTLLAAFGAFLSRYTGQEDIAVGSPIANRNRSELENLIGFFANSLVLRTDLSGNPTFRELLARVRQVTLAAYAHQDLPFEKLVEELQPIRDLSRNPLFQVVFGFQNVPMEQLELPGLTLSSLNLDMKTTRFDLELYIWECSDNFRSLWGTGWEQSEGFRGILVYSTDLFDSSAIAHMLKHFQTLLAGAVANPDTRLADLPLLSAAEQYQLLVEWNQTQRTYPDRLCIHQVFEAQVEQSPQTSAINFADKQFTYRELNAGSNQLAHYLQKLGVGPEVLVGICMERSSAMVAGLLGILKAGGAYVPLDPTYPPERLQFMLEDAQVSVLLTTQRWTDQLGHGVKVVCLERDWEAIAQESEENPVNRTTADNLAYVVYTSGSTGTPKGVAVPHRAVERLVCNTNYIKLEPTDKVAQCSNISFDAATFEIWGALLNGAQLVGMSRKVTLSPQDFAAQIRKQEISVMFLTTALFNQLQREVSSAFSSLRYLLFGGEVVDVRTVQTVSRQGTPEHLLHVYGPTENTTFTSWYRVQDVPDGTTSIPIGRAIANTQLYLLDADLKPVPIGVRGEVYIGGDGLARGYLNRPELTAERFIPHPFSLNAEARLYKTGDLARYRADGNLEFLGRTDEQVKLRGFRIELGEIKAVLNQHPAVRETVVIVREDNAGDRNLVAYIVPNGVSLAPRRQFAQRGEPPHATGSPSPLAPSDLRDFLKAKLPDYMIPSAFVVLEVLPLTPNGKIDSDALPPPDLVRTRLAEVDWAPRTSVEAELVKIWTGVLGLERVGIHDNFFELGGHSLKATQLVSRVRNRFQVEVPLSSLFETPTIAGLAKYIEAVSWDLDLQASDFGAIASQNREEVEF